MPLEPSTRIGPYSVIGSLGAGGMGEVYRARDERLGRDVAIKALPATFAQDPERLARFEREAKLLAALNHPNVGAIYGLEEAGGSRYLVLELVEGQSLAQRLESGPLARNEAYDVCRQIAAALEAAHESGIIHRDLKPGNVMLTPSGSVKVLDFGLAKGTAESSSGTNLASSPTMSAHPISGTGAGVVLGTAAYMSPEQARGKAVDKRTDIWSFGCVLYECLAGRQCFVGETVSDLIAQILQGEPEWDALPAKVPSRIRQLLRRCIEKDARRRLRDIGDARIELEDLLAQSTSSTSIAAAGRVATERRTRLRLIGFGVALVLASVLGTIGVWNALHRAPPRTPIRFEIADAEKMRVDNDGANSAISPDGSMIAFVAGDSTSGQLWLRSLKTLAAVPLEGTEGAYLPFWSPDSRNVGFFSFDKLKRVAANGGAVQELCSVGNARGGAWSHKDVILFAPTSGPLSRVSASGGDPVQVTTLDSTRAETAHRSPQFLPDSRHFLFTSLPSREGKFEIYAGSLDAPDRQLVTSANSGVRYVEPGYLLYERDGQLVAQSFDAGTRRLHGASVTLRESMAGTQYSGSPGFSVSANGRLAYATLKMPDARLAWFDKQGREASVVPIDPAPYVQFALSPDGRRIALVRRESPSRTDIWIGDLERGVVSRFSEEQGFCLDPRWSPDGSRIAYDFNVGSGPQSIVVRAVSVAAETRTLLQSDPSFKGVTGWTPDGKALVYWSQDPVTMHDLWVLPLEGDPTPRLYLKAPFIQLGGRVSSDGQWMAYQSNESGQFEGYVQPFPSGGLKYQVTKGGGFVGTWLHGGKQLLFWLASSPSLIEIADVVPGDEFRLGSTRTFCVRPRNQIDTHVTEDGSRILSLIPAGKPPANSITVVLDWTAGLERK
jgi:serine/threonine protein kinase